LKETIGQSTNTILQSIFPLSELQRKKRPDTAATQFKQSLNQLMEILMSKEPSYIRCIKPNEFKKSSVFELDIVDHQVQYLGLMENLRVRRAGFAYRRPYELFLQRYKSLCPKTWPNYQGSARDGVDVLMKHLGYNQDHYRMGKSKIFIRHAQTLFAIEDRFQLRKRELVSKIKARWRGQKQRKEYLKMRQMVIITQKFARRFLAKLAYKKRKWATSVIRGFVQGFINRNKDADEANAKFLQFVRHRVLLRLSENLPNVILRHDRLWPDAPPCALEASRLLCKIHRRYMVRLYMQKLTPERKRQLELKWLAHELFKGKKCSYEGSVRKHFVDHSIPEDKKTILLTNARNAGEAVVYSTSVTKYDRHGYKERRRILALTGSAIQLYDEKDMKLKLRLPLNELPGITATNMGDGLLIVRIPPEMKKLKGDLIVECNNVIETVTRIIDASSKNKSLLKLEPPGELRHQLNGGKQKVIEVKKSENETNGFVRKNGNLIVMTSC
jgi:myosin-1